MTHTVPGNGGSMEVSCEEYDAYVSAQLKEVNEVVERATSTLQRFSKMYDRMKATHEEVVRDLTARIERQTAQLAAYEERITELTEAAYAAKHEPNDLDHEGSQDERGAWCCGAHEHIADMRAENGEEIHPAFRIMLEESTPQEDA